jgi:C-3',4' desaturase CrtD
MTVAATRFGDALPDETQDVVVVGAGVAGLSAAALLAREGMRVTVLEAIHYPGGCASSFSKHGASFDVGATTFSGVDDPQPLARLFARIGHFHDLLPADPPMGIAMDGALLIRHRHRERWIEEAERFFSLPQRSFWERVSQFSDAAYRMLQRLPYLPPQTAGEILRSVPKLNRGVLRAVPGLLRTVDAHLRSHGLTDARFRQFIDAQLLITSQGQAREIPFLAGALGLSYPDYPVYAVKGGMITYARFLEERIRAFGGRVCYLQPVSGLLQRSGDWEVQTRGGASLRTRHVITGIPVYNLPALTVGQVQRHFTGILRRLQRRAVQPWGALTVYALVEDSFPADLPLNLQVLLRDALTHTGSHTLFCSFSHPLDTTRAPEGMRTLTISTHLPLARAPRRDHRAEYRGWKEEAVAEIWGALRREVAYFTSLRIVHAHGGTPATFHRYTGRAEGTVGGIPLQRSVFPFLYPRSATPFGGLYSIGDTFFPGQGIPGVTLGALSVSQRILDGT